MSVTRFRVVTTATGRRRPLLVLVYDRVEDLRREASASDGQDHSSAAAVCQLTHGYQWPQPEHLPLVARFHRGELYTEVIAHEATHAAAEIIRADALRGWDSRAHTVLRADFEPLAYAIGELTQRIVTRCYRLGLITS